VTGWDAEVSGKKRATSEMSQVSDLLDFQIIAELQYFARWRSFGSELLPRANEKSPTFLNRKSGLISFCGSRHIG